MSGTLYIVATPIGNFDDITLRAIETLREVDLVAAEDTRHSRHLLNHLALNKKMISLHEHNERNRAQQIVGYLADNMDIALISDAGTPLISDPGYPLVTAVIESGYTVRPIPGVSSIITALSAAGLPTDSFNFHGFLSQKNAERVSKLESLKILPGTQIILESTHRIQRLLEQIENVMPDSKIVLAKELTKLHETFLRGTATQCLKYFVEDELLKKGEFVVLVHHGSIKTKEMEKLKAERILLLLLPDMSLKKAVKTTVEITGCHKNEVYQLALDLTNKG